MLRRIVRFAAAPALSFVLLTAVAAELWQRPRAADAAPYHQRVRLAIDLIPLRVGPWIGRDLPVPREAQALLHPNALLNRSYHNTQTGQDMGLLLVQCRDARDMVGHYPPVCYPNQGWTWAASTPRQIQFGGLKVPLTEYDFRMNRFGSPSQLLVYNFMALPSGRVAPDIAQVHQAAADYTQHFFGAAQFQFVFNDDSNTVAERLQIIRDFVATLSETLSVIGSGVSS